MENTNEKIITKKNKNKKRLIIIISSFVIIVLLGVFIIYKNTQEQNRRDEELLSMTSAEEALDFPNDTSLATMEEFEKWEASIFRLKEYDNIPQYLRRAIVKIFLDNKFTSSNSHFLTNIANRAKNVYAFGNFTGRKEVDKLDLAFLVEDADFKSSSLFIISHEGHLLFYTDYDNELPLINSFKKGSKIYKEEMQLEPSPFDGLIVKSDNSKKIVLYDEKSKSFKSYYQYTREDLNNEEPDYEENIQDSTAIAQ